MPSCRHKQPLRKRPTIGTLGRLDPWVPDFASTGQMANGDGDIDA